MFPTSSSPLRLATMILAALTLYVWLASPALAQNQWMMGGGGRFSTSPYKDYHSWSPSPILGYEGEYLYIRGLQAGIKVFTNEWLELSAFAAFDPTSFHPRYTDNGKLQKLNDRYESAHVGVAARVRLGWGTIHAKVDGDVLGHSQGFTAEAGYSHRWQWGPLRVSPSLGLRWYNQAYQRYYYGVSASEAARSQFVPYSPGAGIDPYVGLRLDYALSEQWNALCGVDAALLNQQLYNSPMTDKNVRLTTYVGLVYRF